LAIGVVADKKSAREGADLVITLEAEIQVVVVAVFQADDEIGAAADVESQYIQAEFVPDPVLREAVGSGSEGDRRCCSNGRVRRTRATGGVVQTGGSAERGRV